MSTQIVVTEVYVFNWGMASLANHISWWTNRPCPIFTSCRFAFFRFIWRFVSTWFSLGTFLFLRRWLFFFVFWIIAGFITMADKLLVNFNFRVRRDIYWDLRKWSCPHQKFYILGFVWIMTSKWTYKHWSLFIMLFRHGVKVVTNVLNAIKQLFTRTWHVALGTTFMCFKFIWRRRRLLIWIDLLLIIHILIQIILQYSALFSAIRSLRRWYIYVLNFCRWHRWLRLTCLTTQQSASKRYCTLVA